MKNFRVSWVEIAALLCLVLEWRFFVVCLLVVAIAFVIHLAVSSGVTAGIRNVGEGK
jgi:hypothetical protein